MRTGGGGGGERLIPGECFAELRFKLIPLREFKLFKDPLSEEIS